MSTADEIRRYMQAIGRRPESSGEALLRLTTSSRDAERRSAEDLIADLVSIAAGVAASRCATCFAPLREGPTLRCRCGRAICRLCLRTEEVLVKSCRVCLDVWLAAQTL